jgi:hypothetical protein
MTEGRNRRRGARLLTIGLVLITIGVITGALLLLLPLSPSVGPEPPPGGPDWAAIALLITAIGGMISGIITAVTGLVVALRKPGKAVDKAAKDNTPA